MIECSPGLANSQLIELNSTPVTVLTLNFEVPLEFLVCVEDCFFLRPAIASGRSLLLWEPEVLIRSTSFFLAQKSSCSSFFSPLSITFLFFLFVLCGRNATQDTRLFTSQAQIQQHQTEGNAALMFRSKCAPTKDPPVQNPPATSKSSTSPQACIAMRD